MPTPNPTKVQIHFLASYPGTLLNRDQHGQAKRLTFGNTVRLRVSSQCLKRHWRTYDGSNSLHSIPDATHAVRSRETVDRLVIGPLRASDNYEADVLDALQLAFNTRIYGASGADRDQRQPLLLGLPEVKYFADNAKSVADQYPDNVDDAVDAAEAFFNNHSANVKALVDAVKLPEGLVTALFGRFVTSDTLASIDGAIHVAHAVSVHQQETEMDYFSVVDDLHRRGDGAGAAHIGETEVTSGLYYGYVVVDVPGLVSNTEACLPVDWKAADRALTATVVNKLVHTIATVSPGAKLGSTAPYAYADFIMVETGEHQPRTLLNAFRKPVNSAQTEDAVAALSTYMDQIDANYGRNEARAYLSNVGDFPIPGATRMDLQELASWTSQAILSA